jgi:hypothetical protein
MVFLAHLSRGSGFAVETLCAGDTPPVTFVLRGGVVTDADFVEPRSTGHTLHTLRRREKKKKDYKSEHQS